jgi:hypothetical protein
LLLGLLHLAGQKGIGFKSVFRVTECPHIHTNGFHFSFDLQQHGNLGYVLPTWLGDQPLAEELQQALDSSSMLHLLQQQELAAGSSSGGDHLAELLSLIKQQQEQQDDQEEEQELPDEEQQQHQQQLQQWMRNLPAATAGACSTAESSQLLGPGSNLTAIHLLFRAEHEDVGQKVEQLRPTLLLFLRKLRCLMLTDAVVGEVREAVASACALLIGARAVFCTALQLERVADMNHHALALALVLLTPSLIQLRPPHCLCCDSTAHPLHKLGHFLALL